MKQHCVELRLRMRDCGMLRGSRLMMCSIKAVAVVFLGVAVTGCVTTPPGSVGTAGTDAALSKSSVESGLQHFNRGEYGLAARDFEQTIVKNPADASAWIALAASYDRIGRFDLSDRAYRQAVSLVGETPQLLNNEGFSYMLRGQVSKARMKLEAAHARDPDDPVIEGNLELLKSSAGLLRQAGGT